MVEERIIRGERSQMSGLGLERPVLTSGMFEKSSSRVVEEPDLLGNGQGRRWSPEVQTDFFLRACY
jgi:hypothetical protein